MDLNLINIFDKYIQLFIYCYCGLLYNTLKNTLKNYINTLKNNYLFFVIVIFIQNLNMFYNVK